jgi:hypothetical protein
MFLSRDAEPFGIESPERVMGNTDRAPRPIERWMSMRWAPAVYS